VVKHLLFGAIAVFLLLPAFLGVGDVDPTEQPADSRWARFMAHPVVVYLGTISYGIFLWHLVLLRMIQGALGIPIFSGGFWLLWPLVVLSSIAVASVSWFAVERPLQRWSHRRGVRKPVLVA